MRIDVVMLISGLDPEALRRREEGLKSCASEGTDVRLVTTRNAPPSGSPSPRWSWLLLGSLKGL